MTDHPDPYELRRQDYSLTIDQAALAKRAQAFFTEHCPLERVRAAEPFGFDAELWRSFLAAGLTRHGRLLDAVLVGEAVGLAAAPVPFATHVASSRLLDRVGARLPDEDAEHDGPVALALRTATGVPQLVPDAAISRRVLAHTGAALVLATSHSQPPPVVTMGAAPQAWWAVPDPSAERPGRVVTVATGAPSTAWWRQAVIERKLIVAAGLVGLTQTALDAAVVTSGSRRTLGVPIGTLQGVAFALADVEIALSGARNLVRRAAWFLDNEPDHRPELAAMAYVNAARTSVSATTVCAHIQGGSGYTEGSLAGTLVLRARAWSAISGDPADDLLAVADSLTAQATS